MATLRSTMSFVACLIVLPGCAGDMAEVSNPAVELDSTTTAAPPLTTLAAAEAPASSDPEPSTPEILDWSAPLIGGGTIDMADFAGQQVLLWFWAPY